MRHQEPPRTSLKPGGLRGVTRRGSVVARGTEHKHTPSRGPQEQWGCAHTAAKRAPRTQVHRGPEPEPRGLDAGRPLLGGHPAAAPRPCLVQHLEGTGSQKGNFESTVRPRTIFWLVAGFFPAQPAGPGPRSKVRPTGPGPRPAGSSSGDKDRQIPPHHP